MTQSQRDFNIQCEADEDMVIQPIKIDHRMLDRMINKLADLRSPSTLVKEQTLESVENTGDDLSAF